MTTRLLLREMTLVLTAVVALVAMSPPHAQAEHEGKVQVLLLGDSTTIGSVCRRSEPDGPHLEDVIRTLLATESDLPAVNVINQGRDGEFIHGLLTGKRYDEQIAKLPGIDYIFIRYGLNDQRKRENFAENFPKDFHELIVRLKQDFPQAVIIPTTTIPYLAPEADAAVLKAISEVGAAEGLPVFDVYTRYAAELKHGPDMLNYRRYPLTSIPEQHRAWLKPYVQSDSVVVMDNRLDAHFRTLPNWTADRHPNLAGYAVIGDETAKYLAKLLRARK
ncbi:MAG: SGNH/GDSL hydrolase family protein [Pirellula sp.]|nr:SGNH/GDSL hydrolase family protein [Pirellula sp.]